MTGIMTLTLPTEWLAPLADEAARRGTTPELLALEGVRQVLPPNPVATSGTSLLDTLKGHIGVVSGTGKAFSQRCGETFAEGLATGQAARP